MDQYDRPLTLVIIESSRCLIAKDLDVDTATTLIALISEDPDDWDQAMSVWPRYRTPAVCEFISSLLIEQIDRNETMKALQTAEGWGAIDFEGKRIFTGGNFLTDGRDAVFAMSADELGDQHCPLSIHLPPWWELHEGAALDSLNLPRQSPVAKPQVDRDLLYGDELLEDVAARVLAVVAGDPWNTSGASGDKQARYPFTVCVHRDWLMTPREDLGGRIPRHLLHGATGWSGLVTWGQQLRMQDGGPAIATPDDWPGFATAPMGHEEVCIYFDLCRELINASWFWCESDEAKLARENETCALNSLIAFLREVKDQWLNSSFEGGSPPSFIIQCDRRRVPRGSGVAIQGIDEMESEQHVIDCDCPICELMADGMFGISFTGIDGHHLELDDEFAFSLSETREQWERQQQEHTDMSAEVDRRLAERQASGPTDDPYASAWSGLQNDEPIPGDSQGHLKMAFMVAEIVSDLQVAKASSDEIKTLNECFANYRRSDDDQRPQWASRFKTNLQSLADLYPALISKSADLQSRIDEAERRPAQDDSDPDVSF